MEKCDMNKKSLVFASSLIGILLLLFYLPAEFAGILFTLVVLIMTFYLWCVFTDTNKVIPEDKINQGQDPLSQYFNKYDGL